MDTVINDDGHPVHMFELPEDPSELIDSIAIEMKECGDRLPDSVWETYSSFANTEGGTIILGISGSSDRIEITGVPDAHTIRMISLRTEANPFQKLSSACIRSHFGVSIQDNSSIKITFFFSEDSLIKSLRSSNASSQFCGFFFGSFPLAFFIDASNSKS